MESAEVFRLLTVRIRRGLIIFPTLWLISVVWGSVALVVLHYQAWAVAAFFVCMLFHFGNIHVRKRYVMARWVAENPKLVYWGYPNNLPQPFSRDAVIDFKCLTLHLRNGQTFEAGLPPAEMRKFIDWLIQQNPSIRWGAYDDFSKAIETS